MNEEEAKNALVNYLGEQISPMSKKDSGRITYDVVEHYAPLIAEKLTEERLQTLNKNDRMFILVVWGDGINNNTYYIISPFENGFLYAVSPSQRYFRYMKKYSEKETMLKFEDNLGVWREGGYEKPIGQILNEVFPQLTYGFYLLTEETNMRLLRTLNFSRSGFL
jgi:hypothetical protein